MKLVDETTDILKQMHSHSIVKDKESPSFDDIIKYHHHGRDLHSQAVFAGFGKIKDLLIEFANKLYKKYKNKGGCIKR